MGRAQPGRVISDADFLAEFVSIGATAMAKKYQITERNIYRRRRLLEREGDKPIIAPRFAHLEAKYPGRLHTQIKNGVVIVASDLHLWPGQESTALKVLKRFCDDLRPSVVVLNGDVLDFPQISKHAPICWESTPNPAAEIEAAQDHLDDIVKASKRARKVWTLGNHDARFETRLATVASEYKNIRGIHLGDHFPLWEKGWSLWVNPENEQARTAIKHRWQGGVNATYNNTLKSGVTMVTGHLHSANVRPFTDYRHTRWGVDSGCVAETYYKQFAEYTEDNPKNWVSGFAVLTYKDGHLMWPELVTKYGDNAMQFRGVVYKA